MNADKFLRKKHSPLRHRLWVWRYYLMNYLNNALPDMNVDPALQHKFFKVDKVRQEVDKLQMPKASPSRMWGDLFWKFLNWEAFEAALGELYMADFGCGNGHYGELFYAFSGQRILEYHGYDLFENPQWKEREQQNAYMSFQTYDASSQRLADLIDNRTNLIVSQSAIEHFDNDLVFFEHVLEFVQAQQRPILQVHLFPSAVCLPLYRLHGVRQYTPRTISKITRLFSEFSTCVLYDLGNKPSNQHHMKTITRPYFDQGTDYRETHTDDYYQRTLDALEADMQIPSTEPGFYALAIHSYPSQSIDYLRV